MLVIEDDPRLGRQLQRLLTADRHVVEIGLRRALGATRAHIGGQFLAEAALLAGIGGILGLAVGVAIAAAYAGSQGWTLVVPLVALAGGPAGPMAIGAVAGMYPALRASSTPPTEALRAG